MKMRKIFEAVALVTVISTITRVIAFVFKIYLSRVLGAEILGVYQITISIFSLCAALAVSGIPTALSRHLSELNALGNRSGANGMLSSALLVSTSIACVTIVLFYIFPNITSLLFADSRCTEMFLILLPALLSTSIYSIVRSYFWGHKNYLVYSTTECASELLSIIVMVVSILLGACKDNMPRCVAYAFLISDYIGVILLIGLFFLMGGRLGRPSLMRPLIKSSAPITCTRILGSLVSSMMALLIPLLLVKNGASTGEATASYGRASGMVMSLIFAPSTIVGSLAIVVIPELAESKTRDMSSLDRVISPALTFSIVISGLFLSLYMAVGDRLCAFLYDDNIAGGYMGIASLLMIPMSINQICVSLLNTMGHENKTFLTHVLCSIVLSILVLILPKYMGIYAYFVALIVFHALSSIVYISLINRCSKIAKRDARCCAIIGCTSIALGIVLKYVRIPLPNAFLDIVLTSIVILIVYYVLLTALGVIHVDVIRKNLRKKA